MRVGERERERSEYWLSERSDAVVMTESRGSDNVNVAVERMWCNVARHVQLGGGSSSCCRDARGSSSSSSSSCT